MRDLSWDEMYRWATDADILAVEKIKNGTAEQRDTAYAILHNGYQCRACGEWFCETSAEDGHTCWMDSNNA